MSYNYICEQLSAAEELLLSRSNTSKVAELLDLQKRELQQIKSMQEGVKTSLEE